MKANTDGIWNHHESIQPNPETASSVLLMFQASQPRGQHRRIAKHLNAVWSGAFCYRPCKSHAITITSCSCLHAGLRADPGVAVLTCLEGADWCHHLWLTANMGSILFPEQIWKAFTVCFAKIMFPFSLSEATDTGMIGSYSTELFFLRQWYLSSWSH